MTDAPLAFEDAFQLLGPALPGDAVVEDSIAVPAMAAGEYRIRVALLDSRTHKPAIQLGIAGRTEDGWYDLGPITIQL